VRRDGGTRSIDYLVYTVSQKTTHLTFDHNCGKCRPIYKVFSLTDSWENSVHTCHKDSPPHLPTLPCETWQYYTIAAMAYCMWDL